LLNNGGLTDEQANRFPTKDAIIKASKDRSARFDDPHYKEIRREIDKLWAARKGCTRDYKRFVVTWVAQYLDVDVGEVLHAIVGCFNKYGPAYTAWVFYFGKTHEFGWLPKTGEKIPCGLIYIPALGGMVPVHKDDWKYYRGMKERDARSIPTDFEPYPNLKVELRAPVSMVDYSPDDESVEGLHIWLRRERSWTKD
jgi:hypothetical protein